MPCPCTEKELFKESHFQRANGWPLNSFNRFIKKDIYVEMKIIWMERLGVLQVFALNIFQKPLEFEKKCQNQMWNFNALPPPLPNLTLTLTIVVLLFIWLGLFSRSFYMSPFPIWGDLQLYTLLNSCSSWTKLAPWAAQLWFFVNRSECTCFIFVPGFPFIESSIRCY